MPPGRRDLRSAPRCVPRTIYTRPPRGDLRPMQSQSRVKPLDSRRHYRFLLGRPQRRDERSTKRPVADIIDENAGNSRGMLPTPGSYHVVSVLRRTRRMVRGSHIASPHHERYRSVYPSRHDVTNPWKRAHSADQQKVLYAGVGNSRLPPMRPTASVQRLFASTSSLPCQGAKDSRIESL
jgi:hypothetical protein